MSNTAKLVSAGAAGFILASAIGYFAGGSIFGASERRQTAVALTQGPNGCQALEPNALWVQSNKNHDVTWNITNNCNDPQVVQFQSFQEKNPDGTLQPAVTLTVPPQPTSGAIPRATQGSQPVPVTAKVDRSHGNFARHFYKYQIWLGPSANALTMSRDPDVEAWDK